MNMEKNELRRTLVRAAVHKGIKEVREDPERGIRKLVDLGSHFAKGRFQKVIFQLMQEQMIHEDSGYHKLAKRVITEVSPKVLEDFGICMGYNCWTEGAKRIRKYEEAHGFNVPWCLIADLSGGMRFDADDLMTQAEHLGICCSILFVKDAVQAAALYSVLHKHKDSAVILFAGEDELPEVNMENVTNVMYVLPKGGEQVLQHVEELRRRGCMSGIWESYDENNIDQLVSGADERFAMEAGAISLFALPKRSESGENVRHDLREYVLRSRDKAEYACFTVDLMEDIQRIDRIISVESCMLCIDADGCAVTMQKKYENLSVRSVSLEDMLMCTMPKVTYTKDKE